MPEMPEMMFFHRRQVKARLPRPYQSRLQSLEGARSPSTEPSLGIAVLVLVITGRLEGRL